MRISENAHRVLQRIYDGGGVVSRPLHEFAIDVGLTQVDLVRALVELSEAGFITPLGKSAAA